MRFFRDADLVIFDAMYSLADAVSVKADWGHSSNVVAVELCQLAGARHLCMFHHEPVFDDAAIDAVLAETRRLEEITRGAAALYVSAAKARLRATPTKPMRSIQRAVALRSARGVTARFPSRRRRR